LRWAKKKINMPTVAIGGINSSNYNKILLNGADFIACSSYIWNNKKLDPVSAIDKLKEKMKILGNEIKPGMIIEHKNDLWSVLKAQHVKPGKGGAFNQVELKSIKKETKLSNKAKNTKFILTMSITCL